MDLVVKGIYLTDEAKRGLANLRRSGVNITDLINRVLEQYSCMRKRA